MEIKKAADIEFLGNGYEIALLGTRYSDTGGLAVEAIDANEGDTFSMLTVNLTGVPEFDAWAASGANRVAIDADCPDELVSALEATGALRLSGEEVGCGMGTYRLAEIDDSAVTYLPVEEPEPEPERESGLAELAAEKGMEARSADGATGEREVNR